MLGTEGSFKFFAFVPTVHGEVGKVIKRENGTIYFLLHLKCSIVQYFSYSHSSPFYDNCGLLVLLFRFVDLCKVNK